MAAQGVIRGLDRSAGEAGVGTGLRGGHSGLHLQPLQVGRRLEWLQHPWL